MKAKGHLHSIRALIQPRLRRSPTIRASLRSSFLRFSLLSLTSLLLVLGVPLLPAHLWTQQASVIAQTPSPPETIIQQGLEQYRSGQIAGAIAQWEAALPTLPKLESEAAINLRLYLARAYPQVGKTEQAIALFEQLLQYYRQSNNPSQVGRMLTEQAQLYSAIGQHRRAEALLCGSHATRDPKAERCQANTALTIARQQGDREAEIAALGSLGQVHRLQGNYPQALTHLQASLALAQQAGNSAYQIAALMSLGNTYVSLANQDYRRWQFARTSNDKPGMDKFWQRAIAYDRQAIQTFQASLPLAQAQQDTPNLLRSQLNLIEPLRRTAQSPTPMLAAAQQTLQQLPNSREKAYATIRIAALLQQVEQAPETSLVDVANQCTAAPIPPAVPVMLNQAIAIARTLQDAQAEAIGLGRLGHYYECQKAFDQALALTEQAQLLAQTAENRYLWEWQRGRILRDQGQLQAAIAAYEIAVETLNSLRSDLAVAGRDLQFDFRDTVEPAYRELVELQLQAANQASPPQTQTPTPTPDRDAKTKQLQTPIANPAPLLNALQTIDNLRLAELQDYLGSDCTFEVVAKPVTDIDAKTAIFRSILLNDQAVIILSLPTATGEPQLRLQQLPVPPATITATVNDLRRRLEWRSDLANSYRKPAQQLYDWIIRPFAADLAASQVETLVFLQDGILRSIPMAALYDGQQFLIEQYAIANTLSLTLTAPHPLDNRNLRVLAFGLTQASAVEGSTYFEPLEQVAQEIQSILETVSGSVGLLDEDFTPERMRQELTKTTYPVLHLATHGRFGIDAQETFLVTGQRRPGTGQTAQNEKLTMNQLYQIIRSLPDEKALELLILTACETAVGSDREALGIAGLSVQAGARSAIASLWQVDDASTAELITQFYENLRQGMGRAKALQQAQTTWLQTYRDRRRHPGFWAPMILVGNWL